MSTQSLTKQYVKFVTVEQPTAWLVVALLVEDRADEQVVVSEPRVVRIIQKDTQPTLAGDISNTIVRLAPIRIVSPKHVELIVSPYVYISNFDFFYGVPLYSARPPTSK